MSEPLGWPQGIPRIDGVRQPIVLYDVEFHFTSGQMTSITIQEGRDGINFAGDRIGAKVQMADGAWEELTIEWSKLDYIRAFKRIIPVDSTDYRNYEAIGGFAH